MRPFTPGELQRLRSTQVSSMMDVCTIMRRSLPSTVDSYGHSPEVWDESESTPCGVGSQTRREVHGPAQINVTSFTVRLPLELGSQVSELDRIRVVEREGTPLLIDEIYEVKGAPHIGPTGVLLMVERIGA